MIESKKFINRYMETRKMKIPKTDFDWKRQRGVSIR